MSVRHAPKPRPDSSVYGNDAMRRLLRHPPTVPLVHVSHTHRVVAPAPTGVGAPKPNPNTFYATDGTPQLPAEIMSIILSYFADPKRTSKQLCEDIVNLLRSTGALRNPQDQANAARNDAIWTQVVEALHLPPPPTRERLTAYQLFEYWCNPQVSTNGERVDPYRQPAPGTEPRYVPNNPWAKPRWGRRPTPGRGFIPARNLNEFGQPVNVDRLSTIAYAAIVFWSLGRNRGPPGSNDFINFRDSLGQQATPYNEADALANAVFCMENYMLSYDWNQLLRALIWLPAADRLIFYDYFLSFLRRLEPDFLDPSTRFLLDPELMILPVVPALRPPQVSKVPRIPTILARFLDQLIDNAPTYVLTPISKFDEILMTLQEYAGVAVASYLLLMATRAYQLKGNYGRRVGMMGYTEYARHNLLGESRRGCPESPWGFGPGPLDGDLASGWTVLIESLAQAWLATPAAFQAMMLAALKNTLNAFFIERVVSDRQGMWSTQAWRLSYFAGIVQNFFVLIRHLPGLDERFMYAAATYPIRPRQFDSAEVYGVDRVTSDGYLPYRAFWGVPETPPSTPPRGSGGSGGAGPSNAPGPAPVLVPESPGYGPAPEAEEEDQDDNADLY